MTRYDAQWIAAHATIDRLDLTAAVEAAARAAAERQNGPGSWDGLDGYAKYMWRDGVLATVIAAAPLIAQQVAEQIAQAIEQEWCRYVGIDLDADDLDLSLRTRFTQPELDLDLDGGAA